MIMCVLLEGEAPDAALAAVLEAAPRVALDPPVAWLDVRGMDADAVRRRGRVAIEPFNLDDHHALVARVRARLGEPAFAVAWAQGESLLLDQAIAEADGVLAAAASRVLDPL